MILNQVFFRLISLIGKSTFLKSLINNKENEHSTEEEFYEVFVRDFKNNVQIVF